MNDDLVEKRKAEFARNKSLEGLLRDLNHDLCLAEKQAIAPYVDAQPSLPPVFIVGAPRSGSTLVMQWLASTGAFAYPSNLLSRFWAAPIIGARIQKLLTDPEYDFRDELHDLKGTMDFKSHHGKTVGALSPNEFWYFWRRFLPGNEYHPRETLERTVDAETLRAEITGLTDLFSKPFTAKGMIFNEHIALMAELLPSAIFVWLRRQPEFNVQSLLLARERQHGDMRQWYSFKIRDYPRLAELEPVESVCGQIASINGAIAAAFESLPVERQLAVDYESFCADPAQTYKALADRLRQVGVSLPEYQRPAKFHARDHWQLDWIDQVRIRDVYGRAKKDLG